MKKIEIEKKVAEFKRKGSDIFELEGDEYTKKLAEYKKEISDWVQSVAGDFSSLRDSDQKKMNLLISEARDLIELVSRANSIHIKFIRGTAENFKNPQSNYERVSDDMGQWTAINEMEACKKVEKIGRLNKKANRKSFLNVAICKFRKTVNREVQANQESEEQAKG